MSSYRLDHVSNEELLRDLTALVAQDRITTASLLAHIAEVDKRRLFRDLPAAHSSMHAYCVHDLGLSKDAAYKRIQAARAALQFPAIFTAVAEGRLHLTGVGLLAPHLTSQNADELLTTAAHMSKSEIELLLAQRFPQSEMLTMVEALPASTPRPNEQLAPAQVEVNVAEGAEQHAPAHVEVATPCSKMKPTAPGRFALHLTMSQATYDKIQYAQALLSHQLPSGDLAQVVDLAFDALVAKLEKRKFAATDRPRPTPRRSPVSQRYIPAAVKRAVRQRDQGQCTFVSDAGQRCSARKFLEFDHVQLVARGGQATVDNIQLRCRMHNHLTAERMFGAGFMSEKREATRRAAAESRARAAQAAQSQAAEQAQARAAAEERAKDVMACLRELGYRADEARRATEFSETIPDATLEERVRAALRFLCPKTRSYGRVGIKETGVAAATVPGPVGPLDGLGASLDRSIGMTA